MPKFNVFQHVNHIYEVTVEARDRAEAEEKANALELEDFKLIDYNYDFIEVEDAEV